MAYVTSGSLRGNSLEIGIALVLQDRFSNQAKDASAAIRRLHNEAKEAVTANLQTADSILGNVYNGFLNVATGITNTVLQGAEFIDTMTTVSAITGSTREQLQMLSETAQSLGLETMFGSHAIKWSFRRDRRPPSNGSMITAGMLRFTSSAYRYSASVLRVFTSLACRQST